MLAQGLSLGEIGHLLGHRSVSQTRRYAHLYNDSTAIWFFQQAGQEIHDAAVHEYSTGLSRVEVARNHSVHFTVVPDIGINEGVDAVRNILNRCWFDEVKCAKGVTALESYKKEWNDRHGCWSSLSLHNFASHGADTFRMLAVGIGKLVNKGLSAEEWRKLKAQHMV